MYFWATNKSLCVKSHPSEIKASLMTESTEDIISPLEFTCSRKQKVLWVLRVPVSLTLKSSQKLSWQVGLIIEGNWKLYNHIQLILSLQLHILFDVLESNACVSAQHHMNTISAKELNSQYSAAGLPPWHGPWF